MKNPRPLPSDQLAVYEIHIIRLMVVLFVVFSLLPYGLSWDYTGSSALTMEGSMTTKLEWGSLFAVSAVLLYRHLPTVLKDLRVINPFLVMVLLWCTLSSLWSPLPLVTFKRAIQLYGLVMLGLAIQLAPNALHLLAKTMLYTLMCILGLSLLIVIVSPSTGIDYELGRAWRGALSQKNELGQVAAMSILLWQVRTCMEKVDVKILMLSLLFCFVMLVMSKSSTSMIITIVTSGTFHTLRKHHLASIYPLTRIFLGVFCLVLLAVYVFYMQESRLPTWPEVTAPIAGIFGKGTDLTGRTDIWELIWVEIHRHLLIGLGYGSFWLGPDSLSQFIIDALHWIPLQAHNGYLDILNEQGAIGLTLTILTLLMQARSLTLLARDDRVQAAFWSAMLLVVVVTNFTESSLFRGFGFQNVLFICALTSVTSATRRLNQVDREATQTINAR